MDWDLARVFLAVARAGQLLGAARKLGVDHATVSRRVNMLEAQMGVKLIERRTNGCALTQAGEAFLASAERMETEMLRAQASLSGFDVALEGEVRIGAPDGFGTFILARHLGALMDRHPGLTVQLVPLPRAFSLAKREADMAITIEPPQEGRLSVRKLTDYRLSFYAARDYAEAHEPPRSLDELSKHRIVTYVRDLLFTPALDYLADLGVPAGRRFECAGMLGQIEAVRAGAGVGMLHDYAARLHGDLVPVLPEVGVLRSYWLVAHDDVRDLARVRLVHDFIVELVAGMRRSFV
ncbi:MAG: LysR family transcriptional regulator [Alsobacter sp.]